MRISRTEFALWLALACLAGFGIASYRAFLPDHLALAGEKPKKEVPQGIFSPPGTSESGTVVPPPNPPTKGEPEPTESDQDAI